jgi:hypothetical protein
MIYFLAFVITSFIASLFLARMISRADAASAAYMLKLTNNLKDSIRE